MSKSEQTRSLSEKEVKRYQRQGGVGLLVSICIAFAFFYGVPVLSQAYWPAAKQYMEENGWSKHGFFLAIGLVNHFVIHKTLYLFFYICYHFEFDFIEQYKASDEPWPWNSDPEGWRKLLKKTVLLTQFNAYVMVPVFTIP